MSGNHASPLGDADEHITTGTADRLVYMANQMARFFSSQKHDAAVTGLSEHIAKFWDPRMRSMIFEHLERGGEGLLPLSKEALERVREKQRAKEAAKGGR